MKMKIFTGKRKLNKALSIFTKAQDMFEEAFDLKILEMIEVKSEIRELQEELKDHESDMIKAEKVWEIINKLLGD